MLGAACLIGGMDSSARARSIRGRPNAIVELDMAPLHFDNGRTACGREQNEVYLDISGMSIAEAKAMNEHVAVR